MRNLLFFLVFWMSLIIDCKGSGLDRFTSPQELIAFETLQILRTPSDNYAVLAERYLSRGESYLLHKEHELAISDFHKGYRIADLYLPETEKLPLLFRALFGLAIVYGQNDMVDECDLAIDSLRKIAGSFQCTQCKEINEPIGFIVLADTTSKDRPIYGPDRVSVQECISFAQGTARACRYLIDFVPKSSVRITLNIFIDGLEKSSIDCCAAGGIWKACLQPLTNKWYEWNQKWTLFGIPPNPAWD